MAFYTVQNAASVCNDTRDRMADYPCAAKCARSLASATAPGFVTERNLVLPDGE